jgi:hypothetical protein
MLEKYTQREIDNLAGNPRIKIARNGEDVRSFVNDAIARRNRGEKLLVGRIGGELGDRIESDTGVGVSGYNLELRSDEIRHLIKEHGADATERPRGQRAITAEDIYNFVEIVTHYDAVEIGWDNSLHFKKNMNGEVTAVTLYANRSKSLSLKTMYAREKGGRLVTPHTTLKDERAMNTPSDANSQAHTNKILHSPEKVNTQDKKNSDAEIRAGHDPDGSLKPGADPGGVTGVKTAEMVGIVKELGIDVRVLPPGMMKGGALGALIRNRKTGKWDKINVAADLVKKGVGDITLAHEIGHAAAKQMLGKKSADAFARKLVNGHYEEAYALSKKVRPFDEGKAPQDDIDYRKSYGEIFADAVALYMVNPKLLQTEAPNIYKALREWKDNPFAEAHGKVQELYAKGEEAVSQKHSDDMLEGFDREREQRHKQAEEKEKTEKARKKRGPNWLKKLFLDRSTGLQKLERRLKKMKIDISHEEKASVSYSDRSYVNSAIESYYTDVFSRLDEILGGWGSKGWGARTLSDGTVKDRTAADILGEYMVYRRIIDERFDKWNPGGITKEAAIADLADMKKRVGAEQYAKLEKAAAEFARIRKEDIIPKLLECGAFGKELKEKLQNNDVYATFKVVFDEEVTDGQTRVNGIKAIYKQTGTVKDIGNAFINTLETDMKLLQFAADNRHKLNTVNLLKRKEVQDMGYVCREAEKNGDGSYKDTHDRNLKTVYLSDNGAVKAYDVDKDIASVMDRPSPINNGALKILGAMASFHRNVFVNKNPSFHAGNPIRDIRGTILKNPGIVMKGGFLWRTIDPFLSKHGFMRKNSALRQAWRYNRKGAQSDTVREMLQHGAMNVGLASSGKSLKGDYEIEAALDKIETAQGRRRWIKKAWQDVWKWMEDIAATLEMGTKIAGYESLKQAHPDMSLAEVAYRTRKRVGTPDALAGGEASRVTNNVFLFSNIAIQGHRATYDALREAPWRTGLLLAANGLLKVFPAMAAAGVLADFLEK